MQRPDGGGSVTLDDVVVHARRRRDFDVSAQAVVGTQHRHRHRASALDADTGPTGRAGGGRASRVAASSAAVGQSAALLRRHGVVDVGSDGERRGGAGQGVADEGVVGSLAQQEPDRRGVPVRPSQPVVDDCDAGAESADVGRVELAELQLDDDVALLDREQQQVQDELVAVDVDVDVEPDLPADERHALPERQQRLLESP